ncbi:general transcription factor IIF subunit 1 [Anthonomus grandis grandis]|uniref:general transcription factor IIF subunit 1 n=1 Tax=Anthonomus grandis grandis TaxID=2921223 RepID=UPI002165A35F|nr:general transcription factor IIF subunit 1 [Anthonomus grandis grandis]
MASASAGSSSSNNVSVQEFSIRVPKNSQRSYHVMRFNGNLGVDFGKWTQVKMERENNMREFKGIEEDQPKFGAGSEFGREAKEEARRKKLGIIAKKYRPDDQPWILKCYGSTVKKFKGIREGGISENTAYYVFTHAEDGAIEAFPLHEWYKFQSIQRYKALSAEEAEMEFNKRNKHLNYFSLMLRKRLKGEDDAELDDEGEKGKKTSKKKDKELKISDMDEWMDSSEADSDSEREEKKEEEEEEGGGKDKKKKKKGKNPLKPKKKRDTDLEAVEDSDDGDEEGREVDYISDSSESEPENTNLDGVAEEKGLKKLLNSDEEESEDSDKEDKDKNEEEEKEEDGEKKPEEEKDKKKKKKKDTKTKDKKKKENDPDDDFSSDSSTDEEASAAAKKKTKGDKKEKEKPVEVKPQEPTSANSSRAGTPTQDAKRKLINEVMAGPSKKPKLDLPNFIPGQAESGITEDSVRKYLMRKPMTTTELLQKFKSKKTGLSSEQLVNIMTQILKKINPTKQTLKGKMYLSIKPQ